MIQPTLTITQTFSTQSEAQKQRIIRQKITAYLKAKLKNT